MPHIQVRGTGIHYETSGNSGSPVLLIMGLAVPGRGWRSQVPALSERHRVVWFDNRGVGRSGVPGRPCSMAELADDAVAVLDALGHDSAHIAGVSMGGMIAQHVALRHPHRIRSLALIATHAGGVRARLPRWLGVHWFARARLGTRGTRGKALASLLFPRHFLSRCDHGDLREALECDFGDPVPMRCLLAQYAAILGHDTARQLGRLATTPTLIVRPGLDILVRPEESDRLHRLIPNSRLVRFDDAGHGVLRQYPHEVNACLLRHFAGADMRLVARTRDRTAAR